MTSARAKYEYGDATLLFIVEKIRFRKTAATARSPALDADQGNAFRYKKGSLTAALAHIKTNPASELILRQRQNTCTAFDDRSPVTGCLRQEVVRKEACSPDLGLIEPGIALACL